MNDRTEEKLHAVVLSLLAEGVAVALFLFACFVWLAIYGTR